MNKLFQDDLYQDHLEDLELQPRQGFSREDLGVLMSAFIARGGKINRLKTGDSLLFGMKKDLNPYPFHRSEDNPANRFNPWFRAKDGSNKERKKGEKIT